MSPQLSKSDILERERYEQLHGDPLPKADITLSAGFIRIGDEFFTGAELNKPEPKKRWPDAPFTQEQRGYQKALEDLRAYYEKNPNRKGRL